MRPSPEQGRLGLESFGDIYLTDRNFDIVDAVRDIARELGATPAQVALAWLRRRPGVVIPIIGARKPNQIRDNIAAPTLELMPDHMRRLDTVSAIDRGFPYDFMNSPGARPRLRQHLPAPRQPSPGPVRARRGVRPRSRMPSACSPG